MLDRGIAYLTGDDIEVVTGTAGTSGTLMEWDDDGNAVESDGHAATHLPSGSDPLTTGTPVATSSANAEGSAQSFARSDHVHLMHNHTHDGGIAGMGGAMASYVDSSGFVNRTDSAIGMSGSDFQITTGSSYVIYCGGRIQTISATKSAAISNDVTLHYVYIHPSGTLTVTTTPWTITDDIAPVSMVYKNGTDYAVFEERHGYHRNRDWHAWAHDTIGTRYESGLAGTFDNTTFSIAQGTIHDEDIEIDTGGALTACRLWYRNTGAASMQFEDNITTPYKTDSGLQYDNAGSLAAVDNSKYVTSWVYATNDIDYPIAIVVGQAQYVTLSLARNDTPPAIPAIPVREWKLIYGVIYKNVGGTPTYQEARDYREVSTGPSSAYTPASHTVLTNRDAANSHPATAISADTTSFNGILSTADTTVQAAMDTIDDHNHDSAYAATGHNHDADYADIAHAATHTNGADDIQSATAAQKGVMTAAYASKLDGIEASADVTDATNVDAAGAVMESDFDANTILAADTDDTPAALTVAEDRIVGRASGGNIDDLTAAQVLDILVGTSTNGDVLYYNSGWQRLAKGSDGDVLTLASGLPAWVTP